MTKTKKCPSCGYEWTPRAKAPVECPDCKARLRRFETPASPSTASTGAVTSSGGT